MAIPTDVMTHLNDGTADALTVAALAFVALVVINAVKLIRIATGTDTVRRDGYVYDRDNDYVKTPPEYVYEEGRRYKLRNGEVDQEDQGEDISDDGWLSPEQEAHQRQEKDQIWEKAVERSRQEYNGTGDGLYTEDELDDSFEAYNNSRMGGGDEDDDPNSGDSTGADQEADEDDAFEAYNNSRMRKKN